jgi:outer membrane protein assembly factor BamD
MKKLLPLLVMTLLGSCASKQEIEEPKKQYAKAMRQFKDNRVAAAVENFHKLESTYDVPEYYYKGMLMAAYADYWRGKYDLSLKTIVSLKQLQFDYLEYTYYLEILNEYGKVNKSQRDLAIIKELFGHIDLMLKRYPESIYRQDLLEKQSRVLEYLAGGELNIAIYYIENNNLLGALNHLRYVEKNYPENKFSPEICFLLYRLYAHLDYAKGMDEYLNLLQQKYKNVDPENFNI